MKFKDLVVGQKYWVNPTRRAYDENYEAKFFSQERAEKYNKWILLEGAFTKQASGYGYREIFNGERVTAVKMVNDATGEKEIFPLAKVIAEFEPQTKMLAEFKTLFDEAKKEKEVFLANQEIYQKEVYEPALLNFIKAVGKVTGTQPWQRTQINQLPVEVLEALTNALNAQTIQEIAS